MWTAPVGKRFFCDSRLGGFGHMSGLSVRTYVRWPMMKSDDEVLYQGCELKWPMTPRWLSSPRSTRVDHHVSFVLAKLLCVERPCRIRLPLLAF